MKEFKSSSDIPNKFTGICKITGCGNIYHMKDGGNHNENGPAIEYANGSKAWFYKCECYGLGNSFTIKTWKQKVEELKREEGLKIFI